LSAFVDDELPAREVDLLLRQIERDPSGRGRLVRYVLIGDTLRDSARRAAPDTRLADRVRSALESEAAPASALRPAWHRRGWMAGAAAAVAGVAMFVLLGTLPRQSEPQLVPADTVALVADSAVDPVTTTFPRRLGPAAAARLTGYLVAHRAHASDISLNTMDSRLLAARAERASWSLPQQLSPER